MMWRFFLIYCVVVNLFTKSKEILLQNPFFASHDAVTVTLTHTGTHFREGQQRN